MEKENRPQEGESNRHHLLFIRRVWEADPDTKDLQSQKSLLIPMEVEAHKGLHKEIKGVPPLHSHLAKKVLKRFKINRPKGHEHLKAVKHLMDSMTLVANKERLVDLDIKLVWLCLEGIEAQLDLIESHYCPDD